MIGWEKTWLGRIQKKMGGEEVKTQHLQAFLEILL